VGIREGDSLLVPLVSPCISGDGCMSIFKLPPKLNDVQSWHQPTWEGERAARRPISSDDWGDQRRRPYLTITRQGQEGQALPPAAGRSPCGG